MKKINKIFKLLSLSAVALLLFQACTDEFLESTPLDEQTSDSFWQTTADANVAVVGVYDGLQRVYSQFPAFPLASSVLSDNAYGGTGAADGFGFQMVDQFDPSVSPSDQNYFQANWTDYYAAIYRANTYLLRSTEVDWSNDEDLQAQYEAEVRFLRAYCYFDLVRLFGNIPLIEEPTIDNVPQAEPADVYELIATDLQFAADNLESTPWSSSFAQSNDGRVTKWAAESLLGRVYLFYTGYYNTTNLPSRNGAIEASDALAYLEDVINNSGHGLLDDYAALWPAASVENYAGEGNQETVFSIKYTYTSDYNGNTDGNHFMVMYGMRDANIYPYGQGWGGSTVVPAFYDSFDEDDARQSASIIAVEEEELPLEIDGQREYTGYYVKKYAPLSTEAGQSVAVANGGVNFQIGQFQDYIAIRYADVLLMAAELGSGNGQNYFDMVRRRAFGDAFSSLPLTENNLRKERRFELAFEGVRYWDLLRYGLDYAANALRVSDATVLTAGKEVTKNITFPTETGGFQQIPFNQINLSNGVLEQNTGW